MPTSAAAVQAPVAEASTHLMLDLPRLNWLSRSGTRQTSMPWAASVSDRPGSPRPRAPAVRGDGAVAVPGGHRLGEAPGGDGDERGRADHVLHGVELLARVEGLERVVALDPPAVVVQLVHQAHAVAGDSAELGVGAAGAP